MNQPTVRLALKSEFLALQAIERAAAGRFAEVDLPASLRNQTLDIAELQAALSQNMLWVAEVNSRPVGFLAACEEPPVIHVLEMSVLPDFGRKGLGRSLLEAVTGEARIRKLASVTLTTFSHVAWNAPAYAKAGFRELSEPSLSLQLARRLAREREQGLLHRVAMERNAA